MSGLRQGFSPDSDAFTHSIYAHAREPAVADARRPRASPLQLVAMSEMGSGGEMQGDDLDCNADGNRMPRRGDDLWRSRLF